jgi:hypothetical protein|tara:strand:+ start:1238 stop:1711 length:474 start_codon:yes stop_codon:yes gene_type:complete
MNDLERLNLQKMLKANDAENNTHLIRELKHSTKILEGVDELLKIKRENPRLAKSNPEKFDELCVSKCQFLFNNYTDLFNKVKKDEVDLQILIRLINVLHAIEEGHVDQHEGSFEVGKLLKQIYIDSALRKAGKLDEDGNEQESPVEQITWAEFKSKQ